eukprot:3154158-Prymnesium_polylepis.1
MSPPAQKPRGPAPLRTMQPTPLAAGCSASSRRSSTPCSISGLRAAQARWDSGRSPAAPRVRRLVWERVAQFEAQPRRGARWQAWAYGHNLGRRPPVAMGPPARALATRPAGCGSGHLLVAIVPGLRPFRRCATSRRCRTTIDALLACSGYQPQQDHVRRYRPWPMADDVADGR